MVRKISANDRIDGFEKNMACIGYFDGLHRGHQKLIETAIEQAHDSGVRSMLICFEPDPVELISHVKQKHILSYDERIRKIKESGIDEIVVFRFDEDLMKMEASRFIEYFLNRMNISKLICGFDFSFGYKGLGNSEMLERYASFDIEVIPEIKYYGRKISSSRIKEALYKGNISLVNSLLGYNYYLPLKVIKCSEKGSKWLIEAILKDESNIIPADIDRCIKNIDYHDGVFHIISNKAADVNDQLNIIFEDE